LPFSGSPMSTQRTADIVFVAATAVLLTLIVARLVGPFGSTEAEIEPPPATEGLVTEARDLPGALAESGSTTVVVYLSSSCRFCEMSASFYQALFSVGSGYLVHFAFLKRDSGAGDFLERHRLDQEPVFVDRFPEGARGTPTLVLCDKDGVLQASWTGRLNGPQQARLHDRLAGP
jgi:hypothetical protein